MQTITQNWYSTKRLEWKWDLFHARYGVHHEAPPEIRALGYTDSMFMGWTMAEARQACIAENVRRQSLAHEA